MPHTDPSDERTLEREAIDEPPPFLGSWPNVYRFVLVYLGALIALFYFFTEAFRVTIGAQ